jgi:mono/diheme cytochrome c family protein
MDCSIDSRISLPLLALAILALWPRERVEANAIVPGQALYRRYCAACHGLDGRGSGVVSGFMSPKPIDLTQLAVNAGGDFPFDQTVRAIDGRETVRAHGNPEMPVWGEIFRADAEVAGSDDAERKTRGKEIEITEYLQSIQEK